MMIMIMKMIIMMMMMMKMHRLLALDVFFGEYSVAASHAVYAFTYCPDCAVLNTQIGIDVLWFLSCGSLSFPSSWAIL